MRPLSGAAATHKVSQESWALFLRPQPHPPRSQKVWEGIQAPLETVGTECPQREGRSPGMTLGVPKRWVEGPVKAKGEE